MIVDGGGNATLLLTLGSKAEQDRSVIAKSTNEGEVAMFKAKVDRWTCEIASSRTSVGKASQLTTRVSDPSTAGCASNGKMEDRRHQHARRPGLSGTGHARGRILRGRRTH
jgi:hypothetical protein